MRELTYPSRRLMIVATAITGLFFLAGLALAACAFEHSRTIELALPLSARAGYNKDQFLFGPLLVQLFWFFVLLYHSVIWERFMRAAIEKTDAFNARRGATIDVARGLRLVCYGSISMDVFIFTIVASYASLIFRY